MVYASISLFHFIFLHFFLGFTFAFHEQWMVTWKGGKKNLSVAMKNQTKMKTKFFGEQQGKNGNIFLFLVFFLLLLCLRVDKACTR